MTDTLTPSKLGVMKVVLPNRTIKEYHLNRKQRRGMIKANHLKRQGKV